MYIMYINYNIIYKYKEYIDNRDKNQEIARNSDSIKEKSFLASFDVKFQPKRSQNSFSNYNDPLNNSDFIKNPCGSETRAGLY